VINFFKTGLISAPKAKLQRPSERKRRRNAQWALFELLQCGEAIWCNVLYCRFSWRICGYWREEAH
jgi:hypothetical protein